MIKLTYFEDSPINDLEVLECLTLYGNTLMKVHIFFFLNEGHIAPF